MKKALTGGSLWGLLRDRSSYPHLTKAVLATRERKAPILYMNITQNIAE
jgi:hypothetical protein